MASRVFSCSLWARAQEAGQRGAGQWEAWDPPHWWPCVARAAGGRPLSGEVASTAGLTALARVQHRGPSLGSRGRIRSGESGEARRGRGWGGGGSAPPCGPPAGQLGQELQGRPSPGAWELCNSPSTNDLQFNSVLPAASLGPDSCLARPGSKPPGSDQGRPAAHRSQAGGLKGPRIWGLAPRQRPDAMSVHMNFLLLKTFLLWR